MIPPPWELRTISSCSFFRVSVFSGASGVVLELFSMERGTGAALMAGVVEEAPMGASDAGAISVEGSGVGGQNSFF